MFRITISWVSAAVSALFLWVALWLIFRCSLKGPEFEFDSCALSRDELRLIRKPGSFYKTLRSYVAFFEKLILVASGSIAYLAKDFGANGSHFSGWICAFSLVWLALSVVASLTFIGFITVSYERYLHTRYNLYSA